MGSTTMGAALFASVGVLLGYLFSRLPKPYWMFGYFIPATLILICGIAIYFPALSSLPPASWMMMGLKRFAIMGFMRRWF